jgi:hypothetical protein
MKKILNFLAVLVLAIVAFHVSQALGLGADGSGDVMLGVFASFAGLRNISEQKANPAGIRRIGVVGVADLDTAKIDWPSSLGATPDFTKETMEITVACPLQVGKTVAVIEPADNSAGMDFENQGDRYYQSFKHSVMFDIAGLSKAQSIELAKYVNTGAIFFFEMMDGEIRVIGSKLSPIVLKQKGTSGKKGGDKRGYTLSGDNDNYLTEPPYYPTTLALPGMLAEE